MPKENNNPKQNPFVHLEFCNTRHLSLDNKMNEILWILKGDPKNPKDGGIIGEMRDQRRDRRWIYALITIIGVPTLFLFIKWLISGGV